MFVRMKNIWLVILVLTVLGCMGQKKSKNPERQKIVQYDRFGEGIEEMDALAAADMAGLYENMAITDTAEIKFTATVKEVCVKKGCWMKLDLENGKQAMVKFKDYGFFVPKDIVGRKAVVNGVAYVEAMSVEDQKHYAQDGGKPEEEIEKITSPKKTYLFMADGVLIEK